MANEAAVEQEREGRLAARPGAFGRWIAGVSPNAVLGLVGAILVAAASGFFLMLDAQFEAQLELMNAEFKAFHGRIDTLEKKLDDSHGKVDRRLFRIEDHLLEGSGSDVKRE